jgi:signal transduction histidine kinase
MAKRGAPRRRGSEAAVTALPPAAGGALALGDEAQRLRDYAEAAADWFWEMDSGLRFTRMSASTQLPESQSGIEFIGRQIGEVRGLHVAGDDWQPLVELLEARLPFRDVRLRCRNALHLSLSGIPVFDEDGTFRGYRGIGRDLTLLMRAEEHAATAQSRLIDAIESISEGFLLADAEDRLVLCNSRYREVNQAVASWLAPGTALADLARASAACGAVPPGLRAGAAAAAVAECRVGERWFQVSERRTREGGAVVVQTDITALKRREEELAEKTALLRATVDNMEQGLLVLDADLKVRLWNDRLWQLFGHPREFLWTGRHVADLVNSVAAGDSERAAESIEFFRRGVAQRRPETREMRLPDRVIEMRMTPTPEGGVIATYLDITAEKLVEADLRRAKEEAELASRSKTEFLANMSHELRTPLNAIIGFADILRGEVFGRLGDKRYVDYAGDIHDSGLHLLKLINDVLDVSKMEFGKIELAEEAVDVAGVAVSCVRLMRERAEAAGLTVTQALPLDLPLVQADELRLKQILLNLLSNAVKFTAPGGSITISAAVDARGLALTVADTGIGIEPHHLNTALRPFGQIDSRLARKYQGTGLGLPLTKSLVELHGGRLELASTPGVGTKATVWLPPERIIFPAKGPRRAAGES